MSDDRKRVEEGVTLFGEFLIEQGLITREQLAGALKKQDDLNVRLGALAMNKQKLTYDEVQMLLEEQERTGQLFGVCAVQNGLLEPGEVDGLLADQTAGRIRVGELLVIARALSHEQLTEALAQFRHIQDD